MKTKTRRLLQPIWNEFDQLLNLNGLILCVSGGSDSRALMESVARWSGRRPNIHVAVVDHQTRPETPKEADSVFGRARVLGFESHILRVQGKGSEAFLRSTRYQLIWGLAQQLGIQAIVTAHTQDDQAESTLMDMMGFGGGAEGSAMPPCAHHESGLIFRPLLGFSRAYLIAILTELNQLDYFTDPTNERSEGRRVQVRDFLKMHPIPQERLAALAERRRQDAQAIEVWAKKLVHAHSKQEMIVDLEPETPQAVLVSAFKQALKQLLPGQDMRAAYPTLLAMAQKKSGQFDLPGCHAVIELNRAILNT